MVVIARSRLSGVVAEAGFHCSEKFSDLCISKLCSGMHSINVYYLFTVFIPYA